MTGSHIFGAVLLGAALSLAAVAVLDFVAWLHRGEDPTPTSDERWPS